MPRLFICDDHDLFREGIIKIYGDHPGYTFIGEAKQGQELIGFLKTGNIPDIILLDISMPPGISGYEVAKYLHDNYPQIKVIVFSLFTNDESKISMLNLSVKGFISKSIAKNVLINAIDAVQDGKLFVDDQVIPGINSLWSRFKQKKSHIALLTKREMEVIHLMASGKAYKEIAEELQISPNTVDNMRSKIFEKTETKTRTEVVLFMIHSGLENYY